MIIELIDSSMVLSDAR